MTDRIPNPLALSSSKGCPFSLSNRKEIQGFDKLSLNEFEMEGR